MKIFLIGPGGAGKTTVGKILAEILGVGFVDLDLEFCDRIDNVGAYIGKYGYEKYCFENSKLFYDILDELNGDFVFVLSSGFLAYGSELVFGHKEIIEKVGTSVMLLPSEDFEECRDIIVDRQLSRGFGLNRDKEVKKITERFSLYRDYGDVRVFSCEEPRVIAGKVADNFK